ncbi:MAG: AAA family ATPase [Lentisphaerae bacterium]|nr:AAA family ATPase [Lentisphaerota bacterium]MBT7062002.1 AAA family ATPase [Lentisphaerota bacterium]
MKPNMHDGPADERVLTALSSPEFPDNFVRDSEAENRKVRDERDSILIHSYLNSSFIWNLLPGAHQEKGGALSVCVPVLLGGERHVGTVIIQRATGNGPSRFPTSDSRWKITKVEGFYGVPAEAYQALRGLPLSRLCGLSQRAGGLGRVCRVCGNSPAPYSPLTLSGGRLSLRDYDLAGAKGQSLEEKRRGLWPKPVDELDWIDSLLREYVHRNARNLDIMCAEFTHFYGECWPPVIVFRDEHGDAVQFAITLFDPGTQKKLVFPCTAWLEKGNPHAVTYCVPHPEQQPLLNLDKLSDDMDAAVILTDSVGFAAINQSKLGRLGIICTSFMGDVDSLDHTDFSPLAGRTVHLLTMNHSGLTLPEQYMRTEKIRSHLEDECELKMDLKFLQVDVEYPRDNNHYNTLSEFVAHRSRFRPKIHERPGSIQVMAREEYLQNLNRAAGIIAGVPYVVSEQDTPNQPEDAEGDGKPRWLLRSVIEAGGLTFIYGAPGCGKTSLTASICAAFVAGKDFLPGRLWTVPKFIKDDRERPPLCIYFDAETSAQIRYSDELCVWPYFSEDATEKEEQKSRFRRIDAKAENLDMSNEDDQERMWRMVQEHVKGAPEGTRVLCALDTYGALIGNRDHGYAWATVSKFVDRLRVAGIATLVVDHTNTAGELQGYAQKERTATCIFRLEREEEGTLTDPLTVRPGKGRFVVSDQDKEEFDILRNADGRWVVDGESAEKADAVFEALVEDYKKTGLYSPEEVADLLGMARSTFFGKLPAHLKGGKPWKRF